MIFRKLHLDILPLIFIIISLSLFPACKEISENKQILQQEKKVEIIRAAERTFQETIPASAVATAHLEYRISTEIPGILKKIHVERGDHIKKEDVLFEIDPEIFKLRVRERSATLSQSKAHLTFMKKEEARKHPLHLSGTLSQTSWDRLQFDLVVARTKIEQATVALKQAERELRITQLKSPIDGILLERYHKPGEFIPTGTILAWVVDTSRIVFEVGVSDRDLKNLIRGMPVDVEIDALPGQIFKGTLTQISSNTSPEKGTFPVEINIKNPQGKILSGMVGRMNLPGRKYDKKITLPLVVLHRHRKDSFVYVVEKNVSVKKEIRVGRILGDHFLIEEGINTGDQVILLSQGILKDGERVKVIATGPLLEEN